MIAFLRFASRTPVILASLVTCIATGYSFTIMSEKMDSAPLLDTLRTADAVTAALGSMSDAAKDVHFLGTITLDMLYPLTIVLFLGGLIYRFAPRSIAGLLGLTAIGAGLVDFTENVLILFLLEGQEQLIGVKTLVTQGKFAFYTVAAVIALLALLYGITQRLLKKS